MKGLCWSWYLFRWGVAIYDLIRFGIHITYPLLYCWWHSFKLWWLGCSWCACATSTMYRLVPSLLIDSDLFNLFSIRADADLIEIPSKAAFEMISEEANKGGIILPKVVRKLLVNCRVITLFKKKTWRHLDQNERKGTVETFLIDYWFIPPSELVPESWMNERQ